MTKAQALHQFFSGFDIPAYPTSNVPDDAIFPYLTYELITDAWGGSPVSITGNLWYYTTSEKTPNAKANEISASIGFGKVLKCEDGYIWLRRGTPWCQNIRDEVDPIIKRRYLNITAEYFTLT